MANSRELPSDWDESRDGAGFTGLHFSNLFDQDEDESGERYDLATGRPYNNSGSGHINPIELDDDMEEFGFTINAAESDNDRDNIKEIADHWIETGEGLARAAGLLPPFEDEGSEEIA